MLIKITPETEAEKKRYQEIEHSGVKEFFMFGNKKDRDSDPVDFHEWTGSYRYLEGSLYYFMTTIGEQRRSKNAGHQNEIALQPSSGFKPPFIKKGTIDNADVQIIDVEKMAKQAKDQQDKPTSVLQFPGVKEPQQEQFIETPVEDDESKNAED